MTIWKVNITKGSQCYYVGFDLELLTVQVLLRLSTDKFVLARRLKFNLVGTQTIFCFYFFNYWYEVLRSTTGTEQVLRLLR